MLSLLLLFATGTFVTVGVAATPSTDSSVPEVGSIEAPDAIGHEFPRVEFGNPYCDGPNQLITDIEAYSDFDGLYATAPVYIDVTVKGCEDMFVGRTEQSDVHLYFDGEELLDPQHTGHTEAGDEVTLTYTWIPEGDQYIGETDLAVELHNWYHGEYIHRAETSIELDPPFTVHDVDQSHYDFGVYESLEVTAEIENHIGDNLYAVEFRDPEHDGAAFYHRQDFRFDLEETKTITSEWTEPGAEMIGSHEIEFTVDDTRTHWHRETISVDGHENYLYVDDVTATTETSDGTIDVEAVIRNEASKTGEDTVMFHVGDTWYDDTDVSIDAGDTETVSFSWDPDSDDIGENTVTVSTSQESDETTATVLHPATFEIDEFDVDEVIEVGSTVEVSALVHNEAGDVDGTQTVSLEVDGSTVDSTDIELDAGSSGEWVTFEWMTDDDDIGSNSLTVRTDDDSSSTTVAVSTPTYFSIDIVDVTDPVVATDDIDVTTRITNIGDLDGEQEIVFRDADGDELDSTTVSLDGGEDTTIEFTVSTSESWIGETRGFTIESDDDNDSVERTAVAPATISIDDTELPDTVVRGESLTAAITAVNDGGVEGAETVELLIDNEIRATDTIDVDGGDTETMSVQWESVELDRGAYNVTVRVGDDAVQSTVTVAEPATFEISDVVVPAEVVAGRPVTVTGTIENLGDTVGGKVVTLEAEGEPVDQITGVLDGGERANISLGWTPAANQSGEVSIGVVGENDSVMENVTVVESLEYVVSVENVTSSVDTGESVLVDVRVSNLGTATASEVITLTAGGELLDEHTVSVDPGDNEVISLEWPTVEGDDGLYTLTVGSTGNFANTSVTVGEYASDSAAEPVVDGGAGAGGGGAAGGGGSLPDRKGSGEEDGDDADDSDAVGDTPDSDDGDTVGDTPDADDSVADSPAIDIDRSTQVSGSATETKTRATLQSIVANEPVIVESDAGPLAAGDSVAIDSLEITTATDRDGTVVTRLLESASETETPPVTEEIDAVVPIRYFELGHDLDSDITTATISLTVSAVAVGDSLDLTVYHYTGGEWEALDTTVTTVDTSTDDHTYELKATTDGFSTFAVGVDISGTDSTVSDESIDSLALNGGSFGYADSFAPPGTRFSSADTTSEMAIDSIAMNNIDENLTGRLSPVDGWYKFDSDGYGLGNESIGFDDKPVASLSPPGSRNSFNGDDDIFGYILLIIGFIGTGFAFGAARGIYARSNGIQKSLDRFRE